MLQKKKDKASLNHYYNCFIILESQCRARCRRGSANKKRRPRHRHESVSSKAVVAWLLRVVLLEMIAEISDLKLMSIPPASALMTHRYSLQSEPFTDQVRLWAQRRSFPKGNYPLSVQTQRPRIPAALLQQTDRHSLSSPETVKRRTALFTKKFDTDSSLGADFLTDNDDNERDNTSAIAVLLTVPMAWGTFEPAVRLVYQYQPDIPPFLFSFAYYLAAATALNALSSFMVVAPNKKSDEQPVGESVRDDGDVSMMVVPSMDDNGTASAVFGGIELGTYLFVGNALQVIGLKTVASDKAAFLLQLTTIFVPLVQCLLARNFKVVPIKTWAACGVALLGVALIGMDGATGSKQVGAGTAWNFGTGEIYIILGALFYTFHCIRLELYAKTTSAIRLAASKATTETTWSGLVLLGCLLLAFTQSANTSVENNNNPLINLAVTSGSNVKTYIETAASSATRSEPQHWLQVALATLWTGLVTVAYTIYAQSYGQSRVPATTANLIYSIQPFVTALIAYIVLGETLGVYGYAGGTLIGAAVLLVIVDNDAGGEVT